MNLPLNENSSKLNSYIVFLKKTTKIESEIQNIFPEKHRLKNNKEHIKMIIEQGEKILNINSKSKLFCMDVELKDRDFLIGLFLEDLEQFATKNKIILSENRIFSLSQSSIHEHAFFHLATSQLLPNTYASIQQHGGNAFDSYSIPFKIRMALENKMKSIIGFKYLELPSGNGKKRKLYEFPFSFILNELMEIKCLNLSDELLINIKEIYKWSCGFCHSGDKEPIWVILKALDIISSLFIYENQKKHEFDITGIWRKNNIPEKNISSKLIDSIKCGQYTKVIYYFKDGWSIKKLQDTLNTQKDINRQYKICNKKVSFKLSEIALEGVFCYWCSRMKKYY